MVVNLGDIIFMYNHRYYKAQGAVKFCSSSKLFRSSMLNYVDAYQNFLEHDLKAPLYQPVEIGESCVKHIEGFCYFDCNISILVE